MKKLLLSLTILLLVNTNTFATYSINCNGGYHAIAGNTTHLDVGTENISISFWARLHPTNTSHNNILGKGSSAAGKYYAMWVLSNSDIRIDIQDGTNRFYVTSSVVAYRGVWAFYAGVIDRTTNTNCKVYCNGVDISSSRSGTVSSVGSISNSAYFDVGFLALTGLGNFDGRICNVRVGINQIWTQTQIQNQMNGSGDMGTVTERYLCNEGTGTTVTGSVAGYNLTLNNSAAWYAILNCKKIAGVSKVNKYGGVQVMKSKKFGGLQ